MSIKLDKDGYAVNPEKIGKGDISKIALILGAIIVGALIIKYLV